MLCTARAPSITRMPVTGFRQVEASGPGQKQQLSGQIREVAARELLCLTASPPAAERAGALARLHDHLERLYPGTAAEAAAEAAAAGGYGPRTRRSLPPVVPLALWAEASGAPSLPAHPALPALFAVTRRDDDDDGVAGGAANRERPASGTLRPKPVMM